MRTNDLTDIRNWILERDDFLILSHISPDGDTSSCNYALTEALRQLGKRVQQYIPDQVPGYLAFLKPGKAFTGDDKPSYRYAIAVDVSSIEQLGNEGTALFQAAEDRIEVDHHASNTCFAPLCYFDAAKGACAQIVFDLIRLLGATVTPSMANWLYTGISDDTGNMNYSNTTPSVLRDAAELIGYGADVDEITRHLFRERTLGCTRMIGRVIGAMKIGDAIAWSYITREMIAETGASRGDLGNMINYLIGIRGIKVAVMATEQEDGTYKVSLRSTGEIDVGKEIAVPLGGGGHRNAAGLKTNKTTPEEAVEDVLRLARGITGGKA